MRILFDGTSIFEKYKMGLSTYSFEIIRNITEIDRQNDYFIGVRTSRWKNIQKIDLNAKIEKILSLEIANIPLAFLPKKFDIYHGLSNRLCFGIFAKKYILTLHDTHGKKEKLKRFCNLADIVITISNFSKKKISEELKIPEDKIRVVYNGVSPVFSIKDKKYVEMKKREFEEITGVRRFILCMITDDTYKNIKNIALVMNHITEKHKDVAALFVGKDVSEYIKEGRKMINIGYVSKEILSDLYNISEVLFFPATYGGFGLPIVEAMACGLPVITSRGTAQDEISGDAAIKCNPNSIYEMIDGIEKILNSPQKQKELSEKGIERAKIFSWKKSAEEILKIYKEVLNIK